MNTKQTPESTLRGILQKVRWYLDQIRKGKWPVRSAPACPHCGARSIGWGWYKRLLRLGQLVEAIGAFQVKRFRCKSASCGRTFSLLPPFVLVLKRYAAGIIQSSWEDHVAKVPLSLEDIAGRWQLPCVQTIQRWLHPLQAMGESLKREFRQVLPYSAPGQSEPARVGPRELLELARQVADCTPCSPFDRSRVPYHFVLQLIRR